MIRRRAVEGVVVGETFKVVRTFTREDTERFGELTQDFNPVHYDTVFASSRGYRDTICHGLLVGGLICEIGGQLGWLASGMSFQFLKPVFFGDTVSCELTVTSVSESGRAEGVAVFTNQHQDVVLRAELKGILPVGASRERMAELVQLETDRD